MFGWKKLAALEAELYELDKENRRLTLRERELADVLRQQDQLIYQMSLAHDWNGMRPHYIKLLESTRQRMQEESTSMTSILIPEMMKAYHK